MKTVYLKAKNISVLTDSEEPVYCVIDEPIVIDTDSYTFPKGSVLDFQGGMLRVPTIRSSVNINLNGSHIKAQSTCIFGKNINVSGFSDTTIYSEWFNDQSSGVPEHEAINNAIKSANGAIVMLECRNYNLTGSIVVPPGNDPVYIESPGTLFINSDIAAIEVYSHYAQLKINAISGTTNPSGQDSIANRYIGAGIRFMGNSYHANLQVGTIRNVHYGICVTPKYYSINGVQLTNSGVQYSTFSFRHIHSDYCLYVDPYHPKGLSDNLISPFNEEKYNTWFSESLIEGGRMSGGYGIYFVTDKKNITSNPGFNPMDGLMFKNISFDNLKSSAMYLYNINSSKFTNLFFGRNLPDKVNGKLVPWVYLERARYIEMDFLGEIPVERIQSDDSIPLIESPDVFSVYVRGDLTLGGHRYPNLNTLVFSRMMGSDTQHNEKFLSSSISPYNMTHEITVDYPSPNDKYIDTIITINDMIPVITDDVTLPVLPRRFKCEINEYNNLIIDLTGFTKYLPCLIEVDSISVMYGRITFRTNGNPSKIGYNQNFSNEISFDGVREFRLDRDSDMNIIITASDFEIA